MSLSARDPLVVGRVVPDVLDQFTRSITLRVTYGQREVTNGLDLRPSQVLNKPRVEIGGEDLRNFYTLVLSHKLSLSSFFIASLLIFLKIDLGHAHGTPLFLLDTQNQKHFTFLLPTMKINTIAIGYFIHFQTKCI